ncbi:MAG: LpxL/LpxP family acyltransferase [Nocardioidaceae bacterium]
MSRSVAAAVELVRRAVPRRLVPLVVALRARAEWRRASVRADARAQMAFLLERARPGADLEWAARGYVRHQALRGEERWHPGMITGLRVVGLEHLTAAQAKGHGVVLSFSHHGYYDGAFPSVARHGVRVHMVCYDYMLRDDAPGWLRQHVRVASLGGNVPVSADVGNDGMLALLREGRILAIASDVPGRTPVRFAGRDVRGSFGAARLAFAADAPVVVMTTERDGAGPYVRLHPSLEPADFESPALLLQGMLGTHEAAQLAWPEATDIPLSRWGVAEPGVSTGSTSGSGSRSGSGSTSGIGSTSGSASTSESVSTGSTSGTARR